MIAKRIQRKAADASSFAKLVRYVVDARGSIEPSTWTRTADYILDMGGEGEKVGAVRVTNCISTHPAEATQEIQAVQKRNDRSKSDKTYHLVVSFPPGERPDAGALRDIEDTLCKAIGLAEHQRVSAVHLDTAHLHLHIAINKVHPKTFRNVEPFYDKDSLMRSCELLEARHNLTRTHHGDRVLTEAQRHDQDQQHRPTPDSERPGLDDGTRAYLRQSYADAIAEEGVAEHINRVPILSRIGLDAIFRRAKLLLQGNAQGELDHGRADGLDGVRREGNGRGSVGGEAGPQSRLRQGPTSLPSGAADMEAHAGTESLAGFMQRTLAPSLVEAKSWKELHDVLAAEGIRAVPAAAGLVFQASDKSVAVKASSVDRRLSFGQLVKRLGGFEPGPRVVAATARHGNPLHQTGKVDLFAEYTAERNRAIAGRKEAKASLRQEHKRYAEQLRDYHEKRREWIRTHRGQKREAYKKLGAERRDDWANRKALFDEQMKAVDRNNALPNWQAWLMERANNGDENALAALRSRAKREQQQPLAGRVDGGHVIAAPVVAPVRVDKAGTAHYVVGNTRVSDGAAGVHVSDNDRTAVAAALRIAAGRYDGPLTVNGSAQFKSLVASTAGAMGLNVSFQDRALDAIRTGAAAAGDEKARRATEAPGHQAAIAAYIADRDRARESGAKVDSHQAWTGESGTFEYQGRRRLTDGTSAALLKRDGVVHVMPISAAQAAKLGQGKVGDSVSVDERGRILTSGRTRKIP